MWIFRSIHFRATVRIVAVVLALAGLLVLPGCWVQSVNGLSEAEPFVSTDKDQTYDPSLLGLWSVTSEDCTTTLDVKADSNEYRWKVTSEGKGCGSEKSETDYYEGKLFKLDDHKFVDLTARGEDVCKACIPVHWIFKIKIENSSLSLIPIDDKWLKKAEKEKTVSLATSHDDPDTLTASPKELKEFCRRYADDPDAFKPDPQFTFERKQP